MSNFRRTFFSLFALLVLVLTVHELVVEFGSGESLLQMSDDLVMFALSVGVLLLLINEFKRQNSVISDLRGRLDRSSSELKKIDERAPGIGREYHEVMQKQFDAWGLTNSEQQVVLLMLKGLSFREVAALRETKEKTVRQQAASVYKKSGLAGRHELAAWFLEDLLEPLGSQ